MFRHVDAVMEKTTGQILKSSCSFNENVLFFFLKALFFSEKNRTFERLVTCGVTRYYNVWAVRLVILQVKDYISYK